MSLKVANILMLNKYLEADWVSALRKTALSVNKLKRFAKLNDIAMIRGLAEMNADELHKIWESYTSERADIGKLTMTNPKTAFAYFLGFHLSNAARATALMKRSESRLDLMTVFKGKKISMTDYGTGSGAMSHAFCNWMSSNGQKVDEVKLIDRSRSLLSFAEEVSSQHCDNVKVSLSNIVERLDISKTERDGQINVSMLGYTLNELMYNPRNASHIMGWLEKISQSTHPHIIYAVEPASESVARQMLNFRGAICQMGLSPVYPCPHSEPCPLLERTKDWCYSEFDWQRPFTQEIVDNLLEVKRTRLGASAYIIVNDAFKSMLDLGEKKRVVIGRPTSKAGIKGKGAPFDYLLCMPAGDLDKARPANREDPFLKGEVIP